MKYLNEPIVPRPPLPRRRATRPSKRPSSGAPRHARARGSRYPATAHTRAPAACRASARRRSGTYVENKVAQFHKLRPVGTPRRPSIRARVCLGRPLAPASLGASVAWAALAGDAGLALGLCLPYVSPMSPLCLPYVSPISPRSLPDLSPISPRSLGMRRGTCARGRPAHRPAATRGCAAARPPGWG